ncbi:hypothetical protein AB205_0019000, partial [Aquarana catesbeiana]
FCSITYVPSENLEEYLSNIGQLSEGTLSLEPLPVQNTSDAPELPEREEGEGEESELEHGAFSNWNTPRRVELWREPGKSLGISIVGGRGMGSRLSNGEVMRGIFIKHILEDSPAGKNGTLKTGDRIVEVDGIDLRDASHEQAVEAIRKAGNPVVFLVQSIITRPRASSNSDSETEKTTFSNLAPVSSTFTTGAGHVQITPSTFSKDPDKEDEFGYSWRKISQRYGNLPGELHMIELEKGKTGLGLSLAGNKDRSRMSVFIVGIDPNGAAGKDGRLQIADENKDAVSQMAVCPVKTTDLCPSNSSAFPSQENEENIPALAPPTSFGSFKNVFHVDLPKDQGGLGIAISEEDTLNGVVIKSLTDYGAAAKDGRIKVGDRILAVDDEPVVGAAIDKVPVAPQLLRHFLQTQPLVQLYLDVKPQLTYLKGERGAIIIHEVYEEGAASKDGRLWAGDQILEVNGIDLRNATHDEAINVLRQTPQKVRLSVYRDEAQYKEEDMYDILNVELQKKPGKGLGLSIVGKRNDTGVFVSDIVKGGIAETDGRLVQGDQLLTVNGEDVRNATQEAVAALLKVNIACWVQNVLFEH